jgi:hypothetical protein
MRQDINEIKRNAEAEMVGLNGELAKKEALI